MDKVTFNVDRLLRQLSAQNNRDYDKAWVATLSGISRTTITAITTGQNTRIDLETIGKLTAFFRSQGMPITVADLFVVEEDKPSAP